MKFEWEKNYFIIALYAFFVLAASILFFEIITNSNYIYEFIGKILRISTPFIYAFVIAYILNPMLKLFENKIFGRMKKIKLRRVICIVISYVLALIFLSLFLWVVIPEIYKTISSLISNSPLYFNKFWNWANELARSSNLYEKPINVLIGSISGILSRWTEWGNKLLPYLYTFTKQITAGLFNFIIGIIISIYMLVDKERFFRLGKKLLYVFFSKKYVVEIMRVSNIANNAFTGFIIGKVLNSIIVGFICFASMSVLNMPYAVFISVIIGITNIIPYFGPVAGAAFSILLILAIDPFKALWFAVFVVILQQFDGNILGPKILGQSTGLDAIWVIFAILIGGSLFGFVGLIIGVPLFSVIYTLSKEIINKNLAKKNIKDDII